MGLFGKGKPASPPPIGDGYSVLDANLTIVGDVETDGTIRVDGRLQGSVRRAGIVILGVGATIQGSVTAREVVVGGSVEGDIHAMDRVELQPTAVVNGDIEAAAILMQEGASLRGRMCVRPMASGEIHTPSAPSVRGPSLTPHSLRLASASSSAS